MYDELLWKRSLAGQTGGSPLRKFWRFGRASPDTPICRNEVFPARGNWRYGNQTLSPARSWISSWPSNIVGWYRWWSWEIRRSPQSVRIDAANNRSGWL